MPAKLAKYSAAHTLGHVALGITQRKEKFESVISPVLIKYNTAAKEAPARKNAHDHVVRDGQPVHRIGLK